MAAPLARLERALLTLARVVERDLTALPIFERVDAEYRAALGRQEAMKAPDPIAHARALAMTRRAEAI